VWMCAVGLDARQNEIALVAEHARACVSEYHRLMERYINMIVTNNTKNAKNENNREICCCCCCSGVSGAPDCGPGNVCSTVTVHQQRHGY
jgi:hypothetical protein